MITHILIKSNTTSCITWQPITWPACGQPVSRNPDHHYLNSGIMAKRYFSIHIEFILWIFKSTFIAQEYLQNHKQQTKTILSLIITITASWLGPHWMA